MNESLPGRVPIRQTHSIASQAASTLWKLLWYDKLWDCANRIESSTVESEDLECLDIMED